ncbi:alpha/beta hydrolase family esterase [Chondromyces apiculatus]|uniref:Phospholipase/carboxylesterase/thioesterase domain-containing protein n=1 Tax=Chondromyces apiculatus DSM 436 TaxID=1192034 RepID=A0A017SUS8_9BACT|nr:PHB depolymerase family esterase [Chondromyces apiculatus]EYF00365.1 Hypothetical protein CAP_0893 [Chondromyces apiculatus DSM 436]
MRSKLSAVLSLLLVAMTSLASGCSSEEDSSTTETGAGGGGAGGNGAGGNGAGGAGGAGGTDDAIGGDRPVEVFVPSSYQEGTPAALVVLLHGYSASGALQELYFQLEPLAEARGFLYAHPDGTVDSDGNHFWNATDACCNFDGSEVDDSAYLRKVVEDIQARYTVDPKRIFFAGHSNGGFMSYRMACDHADLIAAVASLAGAMTSDPAACSPSEPVAVLQIHGTADDTIAYDGGTIPGAATYPGALATVQAWAEFDGCSATSTAGPTLDLEASLTGAETSTQSFGDCDPGGYAELWTIEGGSHSPGFNASFGAEMIDFLLAHPKP